MCMYTYTYITFSYFIKIFYFKVRCWEFHTCTCVSIKHTLPFIPLQFHPYLPVTFPPNLATELIWCCPYGHGFRNIHRSMSGLFRNTSLNKQILDFPSRHRLPPIVSQPGVKIPKPVPFRASHWSWAGTHSHCELIYSSLVSRLGDAVSTKSQFYKFHLLFNHGR